MQKKMYMECCLFFTRTTDEDGNDTHQDIEYVYDANGNQIKDLNKGITNTKYNLLNLPRRITFNQTGSPVNEYAYSAAGEKLSVTHKKSSIDKRTDYVGNMIYENGVLKRILVDGGYIEDSVYHFYPHRPIYSIVL